MGDIYNRELSWLEFNSRVMQEAQDSSVPLLQRLRFLGIYSNNQDEFIKVRVANLIRYNTHKGSSQVKMTGGYTPAALLPLVNQRVEQLQRNFRQTYTEIVDELEAHNIFIVDETELSAEQREFCLNYFLSVVSVRLVPLVLRKRVDIPFLPDGKIYLAVRMTNAKLSRYAILQMPVSRVCPRFVVLPSADGRTDVIFLDDIIRLFLDDIFFMFNYESITAHTFKIVRDAELTLDDDVSKSLSEKMFQGINKREKGRPIRLIYDSEMPIDVLDTISNKLGIKSSEQMEAGARYHLMRDLTKFPRVNAALENSTPEPLQHPLINPLDSVLKVIKKQDILLCYPYHNFKHFLDFLREAAVDPRVQSISITLYRTADHSKVITTLLNAAKNGKQVNALVELKARFDEEQNIDNTDLLQQGGVRVIHSNADIKVHSKLVLIERTEGGHNVGYVYIGTGNFNEDTAGIYSDFGLFTANQTIAADARKVFDYLQNPHKHPQFKKLMVSPYFLRDQVGELIDTEIKHAKKGKKAYFYGKFNSLTDEKMIERLYKASQAGVKVCLLVRGACCLKAGVKGLSENIEVRSIVDKYLEHARLIIVHNGGNPQSYIMSADLMTRNLDRRVEVGTPILDKDIHDILCNYYKIQWQDNVKARRIEPPFTNDYVEKKSPDDTPHRSQEELYQYFKNLRR